jgi:hypothetical protein
MKAMAQLTSEHETRKHPLVLVRCRYASVVASRILGATNNNVDKVTQ